MYTEIMPVSPGYIYTEINPLLQPLGTLQIDPFKNQGLVRSSNNQYYLDRDYSVHAANAPADSIGLRLYFTDDEVNSMITATSCASCPKLNDAYELGVTNYTGNVAEENGSLDDNLTGYYQFIPAAKTQVIPFGSGYYIEFKTKNLGEYWISKNNIAPANTNLCPGGSFSLNGAAGASVYQWQVNTGSGYTNISDGANYSGSSTATLQLTNLLTSFTGYKYRCVADGVNGIEYTLRFKNTWTGASE